MLLSWFVCARAHSVQSIISSPHSFFRTNPLFGLTVVGVPEEHAIVQMIRTKRAQAERGVLSCPSWSDDSAETDRTLLMDVTSQELLEAGDFEGALSSLNEALNIRRRRLNKKQRSSDGDGLNHISERNDVARTLGDKARMLVKKGERKQASILYQEAIRMYKANGLDDTHPDVHDLSVELEQLRV